MAVYLVCEGSPKGLDGRVLDALVIQYHNLAVRIEPAGGSKALGAVRNYLESRSPHDVAIAIEDRDYRPGPAANTTWANPKGRSFIWRRHEIENYLLHPRVVLELFNDFRATGMAWANSLPATEAAAGSLLQTLAAPFLDDHAAYVLKDELVRQINGIGRLGFAPQAPAPAAGAPAPVQAQWLAALQQEATRLGQTCSTVSLFQPLDPVQVAARYHALLAQFHNPTFFQGGDYLIDMAGEKLLAALSRQLVGFGAPAKLDQDELADDLLRVLARVYQPSTLYQPDDFADLAAILRQS